MYGKGKSSQRGEFESRSRTGNSKSKFFGKSSLSTPIGDPLITQRRILKNNRYQDIKSNVKSGPSIANTKVKVNRSNEIFKRIKRTALHNLMHDSESIYDFTSDGNSTAGFSEMSMMTATTTMSTMFSPDTEFLLLDVRDSEEYHEFHIEGACNFPQHLLRRDAFTREIYEFKNKNERIIVIYAETENTLALNCATLLSEKGFDNCYLLTGGLKYFSQKFPERIKPQVPKHLLPKKKRINTHTGGQSQSRLIAANLPTTPVKKPIFNGRVFQGHQPQIRHSPMSSSLSTSSYQQHHHDDSPNKTFMSHSPGFDRKGWRPEEGKQ